MKFASKLIHGGPVHLCHRPLKNKKEKRNKLGENFKGRALLALA